MTKLAMGLSAIGALVLATGIAHAGSRTAIAVTIDTAARSAYGAMGTARSSADAYQGIGCYVYSTGTSESLYCWAKNASNTTVSCTGTNASLIGMAKAVSGDSAIWFKYDASGVCTSLQVYNYSSYAPKQP